MQSKRSRLDRFLIKNMRLSNSEVRLLLARNKITLDQQPATRMNQAVDEYTQVVVDGQIVCARTPAYIILHKPKGFVSATKDNIHKTVVDLLPLDRPDNLHIAGRLDFNTTGMILLTNDGRWSRKLSLPESGIKKRYRATLDKPIYAEVVAAFASGIYFSFEDLTTLPVSLVVIDRNTVEVVLEEGRYHQIKRMFGSFQIKVLALHRLSIGGLRLTQDLSVGSSRFLTPWEVTGIFD